MALEENIAEEVYPLPPPFAPVEDNHNELVEVNNQNEPVGNRFRRWILAVIAIVAVGVAVPVSIHFVKPSFIEPTVEPTPASTGPPVSSGEPFGSQSPSLLPASAKPAFTGEPTGSQSPSLPLKQSGTPTAGPTTTPSWRLLKELDGAGPNQLFGWASDILTDDDGGMMVVISACRPEDPSRPGAVSVVKFKAGSWSPVGSTLTGLPEELFGYDVEFFKNDEGSRRLAVSAPKGGPAKQGAVYFYDLIDNSWVKVVPPLLGEVLVGENFGYSLATAFLKDKGPVIAVGDPTHNGVQTMSGAVHVYILQDGAWNPLGSPIVGDEDWDWLGYEVHITSDASYLVAGAPGGTRASRGFARVFELQGGEEWRQLGEDLRGKLPVGEALGMSAFLVKSDDRLILALGASHWGNNEHPGYVVVLYWDGHLWTQLAPALVGDVGERFGLVVALSSHGKRLAISAPNGGAASQGYVRIFDWDGLNWRPAGSILLAEEQIGENYGLMLILSKDGRTVVVSDPQNDGNGKDAGSVRIYTQDE